MSFLKNINPSLLLLRTGNKLYKLAPYQLLEILNYQSGKKYDKDWLFVQEKSAYFIMKNGYKKKIVYLVE